MTSMRSMKAAITTRVDPETAFRLFSESRQLGNPMTCPLSAHDPDVDEFSRPLGGNSYRMARLVDSACSQFVYPAAQLILHENAERPILGPCNPGDRGAGDLLFGSVRDRYPWDLYGEGDRGHFVNTYKHYLKEPDGYPQYTTSYPASLARPMTLSQNALIRPYFR